MLHLDFKLKYTVYHLQLDVEHVYGALR